MAGVHVTHMWQDILVHISEGRWMYFYIEIMNLNRLLCNDEGQLQDSCKFFWWCCVRDNIGVWYRLSRESRLGNSPHVHERLHDLLARKDEGWICMNRAGKHCGWCGQVNSGAQESSLISPQERAGLHEGYFAWSVAWPVAYWQLASAYSLLTSIAFDFYSFPLNFIWLIRVYR